jgi:glyoxylase-like metal-dependent hydrolase (beta-lactamase superfamily II)
MAVPERIAPGVYRVDAVRFSNAISVLLLEDSDGWTLVDTGVGSSAGSIREALAALGGSPEELRRIYLTHHHSDHIGGLPGVREWAPEAEVYIPRSCGTKTDSCLPAMRSARRRVRSG